VYSSVFYDYIDAGSRASARAVAQMLLGEMRIDSLLDVGAGHGAWAAEWMAAGVADVTAVDGEYVARDRLAIPTERFLPHDLSEPLVLNRRFDLVQSLEVAEHLPADKAEVFVDSLTRHGDVILFSAAVPHQGGEHHVNEQPLGYWRAKFAAHGYAPYDCLRPRLAADLAVKPWYRFNSLIYADHLGAARLSPAIQATMVPEGTSLDVSGDIRWRMRRAVVRLIPSPWVKPIAKTKATVRARWR